MRDVSATNLTSPRTIKPIGSTKLRNFTKVSNNMSEQSSGNKFFSSKIGLVMATVGSAVGLGTIWRFPAETQAGGGAAFLIIYIACVFILGIPVMLSEFAVGRAGRSDAVGSFRHLSPGKPWFLVGAGGIFTSFLITIFYMVVAGWTLEYLIQSITGNLYANIGTTDAAMVASFNDRMKEYIATDWPPLVNLYLVIAINIVILLGGVKKGIERMANIAMPMLFVLLVVFMIVSMTLPGATDGISYFLSPDFSKITPTVFISALGQALFSLSLGMGILITYSSYYPPTTNLTRTSVIVSLMTLLVAVMMGLIIFPAVSAFGISDHEMAGTTLVFVTLPEVFANLPGCQLWSTLFFTLLLLAALTSTVSIAEPSIAFMRDRFKVSRVTATLVVLLPMFVFSTVCSLSFGSLSSLTIGGLNIFECLDAFTNNILLPLVALSGCIYVGWFAPRNLLRDQLTNDGTIRSRITPVVTFILRYIAPVAILTIMVTGLL